MSETRVVLVKPGDVLIFGNVGELDQAAVSEFGSVLEPLKRALGCPKVLVFEADIDMAAVPADGA